MLIFMSMWPTSDYEYCVQTIKLICQADLENSEGEHSNINMEF